MWTLINGEPTKMIALAAVVALVFVIFLAFFLIRIIGIHWARVVPPLVLVVILAVIGAVLTVKPKPDAAAVPHEVPAVALPPEPPAAMLTVERPVDSSPPPVQAEATQALPASLESPAPVEAKSVDVPPQSQPSRKPVVTGKPLVVTSALDPKQAPFGAYDSKFVAAVQQHWFDLLEQYTFERGPPGKVILEFRLNASGRISDMKMMESNKGEVLTLICQRAVQDLNPYLPWPLELRRLVLTNFRDMRFIFDFN